MIKQSIRYRNLILKRKIFKKIMEEQLRKNTNALKWIFSDIFLFPVLVSEGLCSMNVKYTKLSK